jgi:NAD+ kinase
MKPKGICLSSSTKDEYNLVKSMILSLVPETKIVDFQNVLENKKLLDDVELIFTIGGDGSVAWLVRAFYQKYHDLSLLKPIVPVIRSESVGYLKQIDLTEKKFISGFKKILKNKFSIVNRVVLTSTIDNIKYVAVNEINIRCSPHIGKITVYVKNGTNYHRITSTMADGVIISTPIGSTGWALSYGGNIMLDEESIQVLFLGGIHSSANFSLPRKDIKVKMEVKNSPISEDALLSYNEARIGAGLKEDNNPQATLDILYGTRYVIDGKLLAFGKDKIKIKSDKTIPFLILSRETSMDKARKLTKQKSVK